MFASIFCLCYSRYSWSCATHQPACYVKGGEIVSENLTNGWVGWFYTNKKDCYLVHFTPSCELWLHKQQPQSGLYGRFFTLKVKRRFDCLDSHKSAFNNSAVQKYGMSQAILVNIVIGTHKRIVLLIPIWNIHLWNRRTSASVEYYLIMIKKGWKLRQNINEIRKNSTKQTIIEPLVLNSNWASHCISLKVHLHQFLES